MDETNANSMPGILPTSLTAAKTGRGKHWRHGSKASSGAQGFAQHFHPVRPTQVALSKLILMHRGVHGSA